MEFVKSRIKRVLGSHSSSTTMKPTQSELNGEVIPVLVDAIEYPTMQEPKEKIPFDEPIGHRVPNRGSSKRNGSMERGKRVATVAFTKKENWDEGSPMEEEIIEIDVPTAMKDNKKRKQKKKKKKLAVVMLDTFDEDPVLSNEATHFRTFARKHFGIILRKMGIIQLFSIFILL